MRRIVLVASVVSVAMCTTFTLGAQSTFSSVRGTVVDGTGAVIPGATLVLTSKADNSHREAKTNEHGEYQIQEVIPGTYTLKANSPSMGTQTKEIQLLVNQPASISFTMGITAADDVTVQASAVTLNTTDATIGNALDEETVATLPSEGRNVPDLLSLQPGVLYLGHNINANTDSRSGSVAGSRSDQGNVTLDGLDNNDQVSGYAFTGVLRSTIDSVQEFRVVTSNANADQGRSSGAQVNVLTKSGTNKFHGSLYEYNRNTSTVANDWFNKQAELAQGRPNKPGKLIRNTFGAAAGGPLHKDRVYFFANYESQRTAENVQQNQIVPTGDFRNGLIKYQTLVNGTAQTVTLNPSQIAAMDPKCFGLGTCPAGPGVNPSSLALFNSYPLPNGSVAGDGLNTLSYTWSAPNPTTLNTYIVKFDYIVNDKHRLFLRGNLQGDKSLAPPVFPGQPASNTHTDNTKGIAGGETWTITQNLLNSFRFGFTRQGFGDRGAGSGTYITFASISNPVAENRTTLATVPVENAVDDLTWQHGSHTFQFGANYRLIHNQRSTDLNSWNTATSASGEIYSTLANTGASLDPAAFGFPAVSGNFAQSYSYAMMNLAGIVATQTVAFNYKINGNGQGTLLPQGSLIARDFKANELEYYLQDSFRATQKLTLTVGLRHSILQTPYEVHGQQVQPTINVHDWFNTRAAAMKTGQTIQPNLSFAPSGNANNGKPFYPINWGNIAPRFALAYAPNEKTSLRAGWGMYYDHFGQGLVNSYSQLGSYGLTGNVSTPPNFVTVDAANRFSSYTTIPNFPAVAALPAATISYPFTPAPGGEAVAYGLDDVIKTPYSMSMNLSVQRELPKGFTLETTYIGRLGRHELVQRDIAMPLNLTDSKGGGGDYFTAAAQIVRQIYTGATTIAPIPYFEDMFPDAAGLGASGTGVLGATATQNIFNLYKKNPLNTTNALYGLDVNCIPGCGGVRNRFYTSQFSSLYTRASLGVSSYNAAQISLRHPMTHGLQFDFGYTYAKSLDMGSDAERSCFSCTTLGTKAGTALINAFNPAGNYGMSDFDVRHIITVNYLYQLPFGPGRAFLNSNSRLNDALLGGWRLSGLTRWTSGLPFSVRVSGAWVTGFNQVSNAIITGPIKLRKHITATGTPVVFDNPTALSAGLPAGQPFRDPIPGEVGPRNPFRGDGYFGIDSGLAKSWRLVDGQKLTFDWEIFNVTNSVRFDTNPVTSLQNTLGKGNFGAYGATLSQPRIQQFSLRYEF